MAPLDIDLRVTEQCSDRDLLPIQSVEPKESKRSHVWFSPKVDTTAARVELALLRDMCAGEPELSGKLQMPDGATRIRAYR